MNWRLLRNTNAHPLPRYCQPTWSHAATVVGLCLLFVIVVGCGSGESQTQSSPDTTSSQEPSGDAGTDSTSAETSSPAENATGGLQMPEGDVPVDDAGDNTKSGPAKAGSGGLDLPNVEIPPAETNQQSSASSTTVQYASWEDIHEQAKSTGRVTVVDLWSLACDPCIEEFPGLVSLDQTQGGKVTCIGVNVDYYGSKRSPPETFEKDATAFLSSVNAKFDNYICSTSSDEIYEKLELVSIPAVLVFDANGKEVKRFVDAGEGSGFTYEKDIIPLVKKMVGGSS